MKLRYSSVAAALVSAAGAPGPCDAFVSTSRAPLSRAARRTFATVEESASESQPSASLAPVPPSVAEAHAKALEEEAKKLEEEAKALGQAARALELQAAAWEEAAEALEGRPETPSAHTHLENEEEEVKPQEQPPRTAFYADVAKDVEDVDVESYRPEDVMVDVASKKLTEAEQWKDDQPLPYGIRNGAKNPFLEKETKSEKEEGELVEALQGEHSTPPGAVVYDVPKKAVSLRELVSGTSGRSDPVVSPVAKTSGGASRDNAAVARPASSGSVGSMSLRERLEHIGRQ